MTCSFASRGGSLYIGGRVAIGSQHLRRVLQPIQTGVHYDKVTAADRPLHRHRRASGARRRPASLATVVRAITGAITGAIVAVVASVASADTLAASRGRRPRGVRNGHTKAVQRCAARRRTNIRLPQAAQGPSVGRLQTGRRQSDQGTELDSSDARTTRFPPSGEESSCRFATVSPGSLPRSPPLP